VPAHAVISLDLRQPITDQEPSNPLVSLGRRSLSVMSVIEALRRAETDDRVKAVFVRLPEGGVEPGAADELRQALKHFRAAGKKVIAHSQGLYPSGAIASTYMLGAAADELWMQPGASFQVTGMASEDIFFKRAFDKYGVKAEYEQRYEFKNAVNPYLYSDYTPAHREATLGWMNSIYHSMINNVAADRRTDAGKLQAILEAGPYGAEQALKLGLIDQLGQVQDAEDAAVKRAGDGAKVMDIADYERTLTPSFSGDTIAVIDGEGAIMTGRAGSGGGFNSEPGMISDEIAGAFYKAAKDKSVKAIVFRVSSPGGSDTASEQIAEAMQAAKAAGKPVVVSMGEYAASGGYWVSSGASSIVANPSTLTGSIGVFGGKFAIGDALARFGVDNRDISVGGDYSQAFSQTQGFSPTQRAALSGWIDEIYNGFVTHVATGRKLPEATVRDIAKGRVWTGEQALGLKLVDKLGGFYDAVDVAKGLAKIDSKAQVRLVNYDTEPGLFGGAKQSIHMGMSGIKALSFLGWAMSDPKAEAVMSQVRDERLREQGASVLAPEAYQATVR
jgi:protease-4